MQDDSFPAGVFFCVFHLAQIQVVVQRDVGNMFPWWLQTCWGVLGGPGAGPWAQGPVQVPPELGLVLGVDQLKHTLVHHVRLQHKQLVKTPSLEQTVSGTLPPTLPTRGWGRGRGGVRLIRLP